MEDARRTIEEGRAVLGIELGSTRIKAVLIDEAHVPIAAGVHEWENRLEDGIWTYHMDDVWEGLRDCYARLADEVRRRYRTPLKKLAAIGVSAMMHGYLAFDREGELLVPFRTWRNTMTGEAAAALTGEFSFHIPQRWSIAHLYQAILNGEEHVARIGYLTTLAGYIHWKLTGEKVLGIGDASGMFPVDTESGSYDRRMLERFHALPAVAKYPWRLEEILPRVCMAGERAGCLTAEGARLLDAGGEISAGIPFCPPEGDAGTGMAATNSVAVRTGNVSAGTSVFAMVVLEHALDAVHKELDLVTTPAGDAVAMVHCNNGTSDLNAWAGLFAECLEAFGVRAGAEELYGTLFQSALSGEKDAGGLLAYNYLSGEPVTGLEEGRPLFARRPDARLSLANVMRAHLYATLAALKMGCDILFREEHVRVDTIYGHGGFFKTPEVGQRMLAAALDLPVAVMDTAGEGGPWGMALLAAYAVHRKNGESLADYLEHRVFDGKRGSVLLPDPADAAGFRTYMEAYRRGLAAERAAVEALAPGEGLAC